MSKNTKIEWADHSKNIWIGCTENNAGCDNCYARKFAQRFKIAEWGSGVPRVAVQSFTEDILSFQKKAANRGEVDTVFVGSLMDIFESSKPMVDRKHQLLKTQTGGLRSDFFNNIVDHCPNLLFLFCTKLPSNINKQIPPAWRKQPPGNVMYGASASTQKILKNTCHHLSKVKGKKFLSLEPLLEEVDLTEKIKVGEKMIPMIDMVDWVIVGGESGTGRRHFDVEWARKIMKQCREASKPFFFKQIDKVLPIPQDLLIRQFYHK